MPRIHASIDLKRLRSFVAVAEMGGVSQAAVRLHITQPALSRQLHDLQTELGVPLFERLGRRLVLTGEGEELIRDCRALLSHAASFVERADSLRSGNTGALRVAVTPNILGAFFPGFLHSYAKRRPNVHVRPVEVLSAEQLARLESGDVHFALNVMPTDEQRFASRPLRWFYVLAVFGPAHSLGNRGVVDIQKLAGIPLLLAHPSFRTRKVFDAACRLARLEMNGFIESASPHVLLELAEAGHGVAIIPSDVVRTTGRNLRSARVSYRGQQLRVMSALLWAKRRPLPRYAEGFADELAAYLQKDAP